MSILQTTAATESKQQFTELCISAAAAVGVVVVRKLSA